jgi:hypothetical protein
LGQHHHFKGKLTQIIRTAYRADFAEITVYKPRMESGRFTGFSKNGPFGKPGILRRDRGSDPPFCMTPRIGAGGGSGRGIQEGVPDCRTFSSNRPADRIFLDVSGLCRNFFRILKFQPEIF